MEQAIEHVGRQDSAICTSVEQGVASPSGNRDTGSRRLINRDAGIRTRHAPTIPWTMTKAVFLLPPSNEIRWCEN